MRRKKKDRLLNFRIDSDFAEKVKKLEITLKMSRADVLRRCLDDAVRKYIDKTHEGDYIVIARADFENVLKRQIENTRQETAVKVAREMLPELTKMIIETIMEKI